MTIVVTPTMLGTITPGGYCHHSLTGRPTRAGLIANSVTVNGKDPDPNPSNNTANTVTLVRFAIYLPLIMR